MIASSMFLLIFLGFDANRFILGYPSGYRPPVVIEIPQRNLQGCGTINYLVISELTTEVLNPGWLIQCVSVQSVGRVFSICPRQPAESISCNSEHPINSKFNGVCRMPFRTGRLYAVYVICTIFEARAFLVSACLYREGRATNL